MKAIHVAAGALALGLAACGGPNPLTKSAPIMEKSVFAADKDAPTVAKCYGAYMDLNMASMLLAGNSHRRPYMRESLVGVNRLSPYQRQAAAAMEAHASPDEHGPAFMVAAVLSHRETSKAIEHAASDAEREPLLAKLAADADVCDRQLDAWSAPPYTLTAEDEKTLQP